MNKNEQHVRKDAVTLWEKFKCFTLTNQPRQNETIKVVFLLLCCVSTFGDYYCFDNVGATHEHLKSQFMFLNNFEYYFSLLYSLYSFPNVVLPFIGGMFITMFGNRMMYVVFGVCIIFGQFMFVIGSQMKSIMIMIVGRIVFGVGGESINICQTAMIVKWFNKNSISLPLGLTLTVSRLGSVLNDVLSPKIARENDATPAYWFGLVLCIISFIASVVVCYIDYTKDTIMNDEHLHSGNSDSNSNTSSNFISTLKSFNVLFWLISFICIMLYGSVLPFNYIATGFFLSTTLHALPERTAREKAGVFMGIPFFISAIMVPIFGYIIDKHGKRAFLTLLSGILCVISFMCLYLFYPVFPLILLGVTYSLFAAVIWPSISIVVNQSDIGFAYGVTTALQNMGMAVNPVIVAGILIYSNNYYWCLIYFGLFGLIAVVLGVILLHVNNTSYDNVLSKIEFDDTEQQQHISDNDEALRLRSEDSDDEHKPSVHNYNTIE